MNKLTFITFVLVTNLANAAINFIGNNPPAQFLASIGGEYKHDVENFHRAIQKKSNWCWAASSEIIFYSLTGATLDQSALTRLKYIGLRPELEQTNWRFRDLVQYDESPCSHGFIEFGPSGCNRTGNMNAILDTFDLAYPKEKLPNIFSVDFFILMRASIDNNVPFGISIDRKAGLHIVIVYGLEYSMTASGALALRFKIYDPEDGETSIMDATNQAYRADDTLRHGEWNGYYQIPDFTKKGSHAPIESCQYLSQIDQMRLCRH